MKRISVCIISLLFLVALGVAPTWAVEFCNTDNIDIPQGQPTNTDGPADPYPSNIPVSGLSGMVNNLTVTLNGLSHTYPSDISILLVGPQGQNLMIMSGAGDGDDINNVTLTFDDAAASMLPDVSQIASGTYKPSNYFDIDLPAPAPPTSAATTLSTFNGTDPNGTWSLYVFDHAGADSGYMAGGWCLSIIQPQPETCRTAGFWGTHGCPAEGCEEQGKACAQNITQAVIDSCGGCLNVCGQIITNTLLDDANSAVEATCVSPQVNSRLQLTRQLTAAELNCCASGGGTDCDGLSIQPIFNLCNTACENYYFSSGCVNALNCFNSGDIPTATCIEPKGTPGCENSSCEASVCSYDDFCCNVAWDGICAIEALNDNNCFTCVDGGEDSCSNTPLPLEDLGLTKCTGTDGSLQQGSAGSNKECNAATGNDCATLPKPFEAEECGAMVKVDNGPKVFNQGQSCCESGLQESFEACTATCDHDTCTTDGPLGSNCGDCAAQVCAADSYCCTEGWDSQCVSEAEQICEIVCPVCGDGIISGAEQCDDGNTNPGDGCDATCMIENGYTCSGQPSVCTAICGDGICIGGEDDFSCPQDCGCASLVNDGGGDACYFPIPAPAGCYCDCYCGDGIPPFSAVISAPVGGPCCADVENVCPYEEYCDGID
jgi:cysteine-rich repeat protein